MGKKEMSELSSNGLFMFLGRKVGKVEGKENNAQIMVKAGGISIQGRRTRILNVSKPQTVTHQSSLLVNFTSACTGITNNDYVSAEWWFAG